MPSEYERGAEAMREAASVAYAAMIAHAAKAVRLCAPDRLAVTRGQIQTAEWCEEHARTLGVEIRKTADALSDAIRSLPAPAPAQPSAVDVARDHLVRVCKAFVVHARRVDIGRVTDIEDAVERLLAAEQAEREGRE